MFRLRLKGDIHGDWREIDDLKIDYLGYDLTIPLGDFGIGFGAESTLNEFDANFFRVLHGNHDNPDLLATFPHDLGRFGVLDCGDHKVFFVAGAWSVDSDCRIAGMNLWPNEQLSMREANECLDLWEKHCNEVDLVISHDCPINVGLQILGYMPIETHTGKLLYEMWKIYEPPLWRFGHWHKFFRKKIGNTDFRCLNINEEEVIELV